DPTEGAALAMSILELLYKKNIRTAGTTHYSELKVYALSTPGVCNASVEFDVATLRPTYKLLIGIPGKSNAFEISSKLGLSDEIIQRAREFISKDDIEFEDVIKDLQENRKKMQEESDLASRIRMDIERSKKDLENRLEKLDEQKERVLRDAQREALSIVKRSKEEADQIIKELREAMEKEAADKAVIIEQARLKLKRKQDETEEKIGEAVFNKVSHKPPKQLKLGDTVKIVNLNQKGYVLTLPDEQGNLMVQAGIMKVNVNINNLAMDQEEKQSAKKHAGLNLNTEKARSISTQIDVRGQSLEEALMNVDKYIDDAYLAGAGQITIVHGKGTGILRAGIMQSLRSHPHVKTVRGGAYNEGGAGATIVEVKS
ncbi:MAG: endonuclease MutS2, partial [Clostridia bacterium]|nr:endonuclease MutS2 [Clostridia bacterium]